MKEYERVLEQATILPLENITRLQVYSRENLIAPEFVKGQQRKIRNRNAPQLPPITTSAELDLDFTGFMGTDFQTYLRDLGLYAPPKNVESERRNFALRFEEHVPNAQQSTPDQVWIEYETQIHDDLRETAKNALMYKELKSFAENLQVAVPYSYLLSGIDESRDPGLFERLRESESKEDFVVLNLSERLLLGVDISNIIERKMRMTPEMKVLNLNILREKQQQSLKNIAKARETLKNVSTLDLFDVIEGSKISTMKENWKVELLNDLQTSLSTQIKDSVASSDYDEIDFDDLKQYAFEELLPLLIAQDRVSQTLDAYQENPVDAKEVEIQVFAKYAYHIACTNQLADEITDEKEDALRAYISRLLSDATEFCAF